jgi:hypothetical protein
MHVDPEIRQATVRALGVYKLPSKKREAIEGAFEKYRVACQISRGPDPARKANWTRLAKLYENDLVWLLRNS